MKRSTYTRSIGVPRSKPQLGSIGVTRRRSPRSGGRRRRQSTYARRTGLSRRRTAEGTNLRQLADKAAIIVPSWRHPSPAGRSWSSRRTRTTASSRSARRSPPGRRRGAVVELLTVLALDPARARLRAAGTSVRGSRPRARLRRGAVTRTERPARSSGASPPGCPFGSVDYERHGDEDDVRAAVAAEPRRRRRGAPARLAAHASRPRVARAAPRRDGAAGPCRPLRRAAVHAEGRIRARGARVARGRPRRPRVRERLDGPPRPAREVEGDP